MHQSPFATRGVIEGFYGSFYTWPERIDLIQFVGDHGFNLYVYGPKNDRQHRHRWWEPYPEPVMDQFSHAVRVADAAGVRFCYAISPLEYNPAHDFPRLTRKIRMMFDSGVRHFSVLVDDLLCALHQRSACKQCPWPAVIDTELCNGLYAWLQALDPACTLRMCPTEYHGQAPFSTYIHDLGTGLHPQIDVFYTGPDVCSSHISAADTSDFAAAVRRAPLIWDNYPVNDLAMRPYMHIGPITGRDAALAESVRGVVVNLMLQPEASKIPLLTWAEFLADPASYDPWAAWHRALRVVGGDTSWEPLLRFAENSLHSCLSLAEPTVLERLSGAAVAAIGRSELPAGSPTLQALSDYLAALDDACYKLKHRMSNLRLRHELLPWVEALDESLSLGKHALRVLEAAGSGQLTTRAVRGLARAVEEAQFQHKQTSGLALLAVAEAALQMAASIVVIDAAPREAVPEPQVPA